MTIEEKLLSMGITLPTPPIPLAAYVPSVNQDGLLYISGQGPTENGVLNACGKVGKDVTLEDGVHAARLCAINLLAQMKAALGSLDLVERIVNLKGYVACSDDFYMQPQVINGASELMTAIFGDAGKHSRSAVGVAALPLNFICEVEAIVKIKQGVSNII